jgi:hypothetical protein
MKKFWIVYGQKNNGVFEKFESYKDAEDHAKRSVGLGGGCDYFILEAIAVAKQPIPAVEISTL